MMVKMVSESEHTPEPLETVIVPTIPEHIIELRETIRDEDRREIESYGFSCEKGLWRSYKRSLMTRTGLINGKVAAVWGCGGVYMGTVGAPWLMTAHCIKQLSPLKIARIYQKEVYEMLEMFPLLENWVQSSYTESIRLLTICGFSVGEPEKLGNSMFRKFSMERK